ncbi:MAG: thioredoxin-disulfide reductase [Candidatus Eisenbacteria bacterium]|nr:thioredoxin-disulfide reductase [Candidatus Eisenbacteria bacterium]
MERHDIVVIGGGPAGLTAGIYGGRSLLSTVVLESMMPGGQVTMTSHIENYPGTGRTTGADLTAGMTEQATECGAVIKTLEARAIQSRDGGFEITTSGEPLWGKAVVLAMGTAYKKLGVPGESEFVGRGVSYCATCDGPLYKGQEIAVVGGGDSALQEALYLTTFASKIYLIHRRDRFRAVPVLQERVRANEKIECLCSHVVEKIGGTSGVESIVLKDLKTGTVFDHPVPGIFLFVGLEPRTSLVKDMVEMDDGGFILTDEDMKTKVRGMLAAGDCRAKLLRQISTAVGDGATAAYAAQRLIEDDEW